MSKDAVLVACPSYAGKEYCLDEWVEAYKALDYPNVGALIIDNTRASTGYTERILKTGVRAIHMEPGLTFEETFYRSWQWIHQEAVIEGFDYIFSIEQDTIVPPDSLNIMMASAKVGDLGIVTHTYPMHMLDITRKGVPLWRNKERFVYNELGCCLFKTELLTLALADVSRYPNFTMALFMSANKYLMGWATLCNPLKGRIKHIDGYEMEFNQYLATKPDDNRINPYEGLDTPEFVHETPPSIAEDYKQKNMLIFDPNTHKAMAAGSKVSKEPGENGKTKILPRVRMPGEGETWAYEGETQEEAATRNPTRQHQLSFDAMADGSVVHGPED